MVEKLEGDMILAEELLDGDEYLVPRWGTILRRDNYYDINPFVKAGVEEMGEEIAFVGVVVRKPNSAPVYTFKRDLKEKVFRLKK